MPMIVAMRNLRFCSTRTCSMGFLHLQLASEEEHERHDANERAGDSVGTQAVGADGGQAVQ